MSNFGFDRFEHLADASFFVQIKPGQVSQELYVWEGQAWTFNVRGPEIIREHKIDIRPEALVQQFRRGL